jgi:hypothetical protein
MNCCDFHNLFPDIVGPCMMRAGSVTIPLPTEAELAAAHEREAVRLYQAGRISSGCRQTPCTPCNGRVGMQACECNCHGR